MNSGGITIAVDGYSSCGKSTLAKDLAKKMNYIFIDSGAMYRGITLYALENGLIRDGKVNEEGLIEELDKINLAFKLNQNSEPELYLNNENVAEQIRTAQVSGFVSLVAKIGAVRKKLVAMQRKMGERGGIVMDGRDIGSVVFPNAELKLFVTADIEIRTDRRYNELISKGMEITREEIQNNLLERDMIDSSRKESPLIRAEDAIIIDNSHLTKDEQLTLAYDLAIERLNQHNQVSL